MHTYRENTRDSVALTVITYDRVFFFVKIRTSPKTYGASGVRSSSSLRVWLKLIWNRNASKKLSHVFVSLAASRSVEASKGLSSDEIPPTLVRGLSTCTRFTHTLSDIKVWLDFLARFESSKIEIKSLPHSSSLITRMRRSSRLRPSSSNGILIWVSCLQLFLDAFYP